ncbi:MAG TPA: MATE family efflux transporter, partial [Bacteroidetes bacterium]|nr:MATE family efflux transporter [Bacteroidota bacterium]
MESLNKFQSKSLSQLILEFSLPATIGMIVNYSYNIINRIFVGNKIGADALSGVAVLFPIFIIIYGIAFMIGMGGQTNVSIKLGEKKYDDAEKILGNTLSLIIIASIILFAAINIFLEPMLDLTGSVGAMRAYSRDFMIIASYGIIFQSISFGLNNIIRAQGFPNIAMWTQIIGALLNIILDYYFIMVLNWGVKGAAIGTNISTFVSMSWVLYFYFSKKSILRFKLSNIIPKKAIVGIILAIGSPTLVTQISGSVVTLLLNHILLKNGGSNAIATMAIINGIESFLFVP